MIKQIIQITLVKRQNLITPKSSKKSWTTVKIYQILCKLNNFIYRGKKDENTSSNEKYGASYNKFQNVDYNLESKHDDNKTETEKSEIYDQYNDFEDIASVDLKNFKVSTELDKYGQSMGKKTNVNNISGINKSESADYYAKFDKLGHSKSGIDEEVEGIFTNA